jgi:hypothetical protein
MSRGNTPLLLALLKQRENIKRAWIVAAKQRQQSGAEPPR